MKISLAASCTTFSPSLVRVSGKMVRNFTRVRLEWNFRIVSGIHQQIMYIKLIRINLPENFLVPQVNSGKSKAGESKFIFTPRHQQRTRNNHIIYEGEDRQSVLVSIDLKLHLSLKDEGSYFFGGSQKRSTKIWHKRRNTTSTTDLKRWGNLGRRWER